MNGYSRHTKYRTGVYRRHQLKTVLLTTVTVLVLVFIALLILGNLLTGRSEEDPSNHKEEQSTLPASEALSAPPAIRALPVLLETEGTDTLSSRLKALTDSGYTCASIPLNRTDGALLYRSALASPLSLTLAGEYTVTPEGAVNRARESGVYLSGTFHLNGWETEDDLVRSVTLSKWAAVVAEALRAGIDEVLVIPSSLTAEQIPLLLQFADSVRTLAPEGALGCAIPPSLLSEADGESSILALSRGFHFLALNLTQTGTESPTAYVESTMASSGGLFYLLRYEMRLLLPETEDKDTEGALLGLVEENWTSNWQILSRLGMMN